MSNNLTDFGERAALDTFLTGKYLGLFTTTPGESSAGVEVSGFGYIRKAIAFDPAETVDGETKALNTDQETFTATGGNFGTIRGWGLFDAESGGDLHMYGDFAVAQTINDGNSYNLAIGQLEIEAL